MVKDLENSKYLSVFPAKQKHLQPFFPLKKYFLISPHLPFLNGINMRLPVLAELPKRSCFLEKLCGVGQTSVGVHHWSLVC